MNRTLLLYGLGLWLVGTIVLRMASEYLLHPGSFTRTLALFALSFLATGWLARRLCLRLGLGAELWPAGAVSLAVPTLLLDSLSTAFFPTVFPNIAPAAAGLFGGCMLSCRAGALVAATLGLQARAAGRR